MTPEARDAQRGRHLVKCREVRAYIASHPGITCEEVHAAIPQAGGTIPTLLLANLIRPEGGGKRGPRRY